MGELGGDYFDFFPISDSKFGVLIGDVAGHGVPAALLMAMAKGAVFNNLNSWDSPEELLKHINDVIISSKKSRHQTRLFSCLYLVGDRDTGKIRIVNAGHNYPIHVKPVTRGSEYLEIPGSPLGTLKKPRIGNLDLEILPGEFLVLYTDGAVEVRNNAGMEFGYSRWQELMLKVGATKPEIIFESLLKEHLRHRGETSPQDDVTIIVLSRA